MASDVHPEGGLGEADLGAGAHAAPILQVQVQRLNVILQVVLHFERFAAAHAGPEDEAVWADHPGHLPTDVLFEL